MNSDTKKKGANAEVLSKITEMEELSTGRLATLTTDVEHLKESLHGIKKRMDDSEREQRDSFNRVFDKLDAATKPRPTPWNVILTAVGVAVGLLTALAGGLLTLILALAAWANAYFSEMVARAEAKQDEQRIRLDAIERRVEHQQP